jgi:RND family efflux transporter MFP subunit
MRYPLPKWVMLAGALTVSFIVILVAVFPGLFGIGPAATAEEAEIKGTATVTTVEVAQGSLAPTARAYGAVTSSPRHTFVIALMRDGVFKSINVHDGEAVKTHEALFTVTTAPATAAAYAQAKSAVDFATQERARVERMFANKLATNDQVSTARKAMADAQVQLEQQRMIGAGASEEVIRAPFDGVITGLKASAGDKVQANETIATLSSRADVIVELTLEPQDASKLEPGAAVRLSSPFQGAMEITGKLTSVGGNIDPTTHLVKAFVDVDATDAHLTLGETLVARIDLPPRQGLVIPRTALLEDASGPYVFTISEGEAKKQNIKVLIETDDMALIDPDSFDPALGTRVVVSGNTELDDDTPVEEAKS